MAGEEPIKVVIDDDDDNVTVDPHTGTIATKQPDGGVVVQLDAHRPKDDDSDEGFYANLVEDIDGMRLGQIANELIEQIQADDNSRSEYLQIRARGLDLLGTKLQEPKSSVGDSAGAVEGMSTVTNPLLLEACLKGWANAQAELLPADGPVKIKDDGDETANDDEQAERLERDFNHYLTVSAPEYYPDTSHMLLWGVYFGGSGFKKVYRCPMRRRPVSESVDAKDLIVSDTTKDLRACARITHQIMMRPSVMKRMKLIGAYRDTELTQPTPTPNVVDAKIAGIQGTAAMPDRPEDQPYTIWETQAELDLDQYAPKGFKGEGIPLPFLVTIDKDSRSILAIRRDWDEDDDQCTRQRMYVRYPYVPGPGFYGTGMLNILGNASAAMTAAWRLALDAGMYAIFPAFLIAKLGGRQNTSDFRVSPGTGIPIETNGMPISQVATGLPYKDVTPGILALIDKITTQSQSLGGSAEAPTAEGIQNVPVGTMLAQIEQATKVMSAAHKGMCNAQSEEIQLLLKLFRDNPQDFINSLDKDCRAYWDEAKFLQALDNCQLVPVSDPNVPSHIHRVAKAVALVQLSEHPVIGPRLNGDEITRRVLRAMKEDPNGLQQPAPPAQPGQQADPAKMMQAQAQMLGAQAAQQKAGVAAQTAQTDATLDQQKLAAEQDIKQKELDRELVIHQGDQAKLEQDQARESARLQSDHALGTMDVLQRQQDSQQQHALEAASLQQKADESQRQAGLAALGTQADAAHNQQQHGLAVAQAVSDAAHQAREHSLNVAVAKHDAHVDLHPPKPPAGVKPKGRK